MRAVIFAGGDLDGDTVYTPQSGDVVICADSGYKNCMAAGAKPDVVLGDFDSMPDYGDSGALRYKSEKDETDTLLAVNYAMEKGCGEIVILGALGGRLDHEIANIYLLKKILDGGAEGIIDGGKNKILLVNKEMCLKRGNSKYVSVFPVFGDAEGVTVTGTKYTLDNFRLRAGDTVGVSNEIVEPQAKIRVKNGYLLVLMCSD